MRALIFSWRSILDYSHIVGARNNEKRAATGARPRNGRGDPEAVAHILDGQGWAGFTTNAVADAAGVSIGSLYQYFPNKLALVEAILRRGFDVVLAALRIADQHTTHGHASTVWSQG